MKKLILIITILLSMTFLGFTVQASQTYDLDDPSYLIDSIGFYEIDNAVVNSRVYVNFKIDNWEAISFKIYQKFNSSIITKKYIKVTLQKLVNSKWISIFNFKLVNTKIPDGYLGEMENQFVAKGQYRFSFISRDSTIKLKHVTSGKISAPVGKKSMATTISVNIFDFVQVSKKKGIGMFGKKYYTGVSYDTTKNQWAKFKIKKKKRVTFGIRVKTLCGKVKIAVYNKKNKKLFSKTFTSKNKYGIVKTKTLKKGTYYVKVTRIKQKTTADVYVGMINNWNKKYQSMKKLLNLNEEEGDGSVDNEIEGYDDSYDNDFVLNWRKGEF